MIRHPRRATDSAQERARGLLKVLGYRLRHASQSPFDGYVYSTMFSNNQLGYASGLAWTMLLLMLLTTLALFRSARYWVFYPEEN